MIDRTEYSNINEAMNERVNDIKQIRRQPRVGGRVLNLYKRLCETPLERLERLRHERPEYAREVLSYAGRLDPMAEGVMLALVGNANSERDQYLDMSKEYVLDILFGFATDTYDILGRVMESGDADGISKKSIEEGLNEFRGSVDQEYPPYSSKTVEGKSLFEWARSNMMSSIVVPHKNINVYEIELDGMYKIGEKTLLNYIEQNVEKVNGDFRQEEVMTIWHRHLRKNGERSFPCATVKISCSSGAYARSIAHKLGQELGVPALALHILRTKVGEYSIESSIR
jgi:tRNA pseudouridine55 synthase